MEPQFSFPSNFLVHSQIFHQLHYFYSSENLQNTPNLLQQILNYTDQKELS